MVVTLLMLLIVLLLFVSISSGHLLFDVNLIHLEAELVEKTTLFFFMVVLIASSIFMWSLSYMSTFYKMTVFFVSLMSFVVSMLLLILSKSLFMVFLGWEGLGVTSFILIVFYQNWMSAKGGLLTLLTNRLGDAVLMILFCVWMSSMSINFSSSFFMSIILLGVAMTKSAQWPFISWLPAAMAAPTPVSSLVHSSTLVTAGIWLMIRFGLNMAINTVLWSFIGMITLSVASLAALMETDAKKVVALSTLSQLGLMFVSLSLGSVSICLFHILMHALAKANLFMIIGSLLHSSFSQQDARFISSSSVNIFMVLSMIISLFSLVGVSFMAGYFSKEQILFGQYFLISSGLSWLGLILMSSFTAAYCLKLFLTLSGSSNQNLFQYSFISLMQFIPVTLLSSLSVSAGLLFSMNLTLTSLLFGSMEGDYWMFAVFGVLLFLMTSLFGLGLYGGFYSQLKEIDFFLNKLTSMKALAVKMESSSMETLYLYSSLMAGSMKSSARSLFLLCLVLIFIFIY